jgi:hypothetical protein
MANSVIQERGAAPDWPLGFVAVPTIGMPVNIMANVDPNNNNAPSTPTGPGTPVQGIEYTPSCHKITFTGYQPAANNNGFVPNKGQVYILRMPVSGNFGGPGNRSDPGVILYILQSGGSVTIQTDEAATYYVSPYRYGIDADYNGDGALVTLLGMQ